MDQSDDDHSFELIDSDDLHTDKSDHTDSESYEIIGSEELNSFMKDMEDLNSVGNISEENDFGLSDWESADTSKSAGNISEGNDFGLSDSESADTSKSAGNISEGNDYGISDTDTESDDTSKSGEQQLDDMDRYSDKSTDSELSFSDETTYLWDALIPINELDDKYRWFKRRAVMYEMADISMTDEFSLNIKLPKDMEIKDVVKDHVLPFLPAKSLVRFRTVLKDWDKWITHPFLAHLQSYCFQDMSGFFCQDGLNHFFVPLDQSAYGIPNSALSFLPRIVEIRSSCKGLLLCQGVGGENGENEYYVCNPANRKYHVLPQSTYYHGPHPNLVLAFEPSPLNCGENYKVICAFDLYNSPMICFDIYNSETRSWSCSNAVCSELGVPYLKDNGLYKNGVAYWSTSSGELLAFDTINDICGVQPVCSDIKAEGILTLVDGDLSYIQSYIKPVYLESGISCDETVDVNNTCIIEIFGGVTMCLERRDTVELNMKIYDTQSFRVLFAANRNFLIFNIDNILYSCDVKEEKFEVIRRSGITSSTTYIPYVNSLVSLP